jgi:hypothetical protein
VAFLDVFGAAHRALLESAAQRMVLSRGQYLLRRGEPGGDVFVLIGGLLEAVDSRTLPETILNTLPPGSVVGEMAFLDDSPRSVDVRAGADAEILRWTRDDLRSLLTAHPDLAASFYEQVAKLASGRVRSLSDGAVRGAFGHESQGASDLAEIRAWADRIADRVQAALPPIETALREDPDDAQAVARAREVLDRLEGELAELLEATTSPSARAFAADHLHRELHAYLVRSALAERAARKTPGPAGTASLLELVLQDRESGDGRLGAVVDRWLLDRPTMVALRDLARVLLDQAVRALPREDRPRILVVAGGPLANELVARIDRPAVVTVIDQSRDALRALTGSDAVEVRPIQENLTRFASGRGALDLPRQQVVVVHGLVEYLPERLAVSLLTVASGLIEDYGLIVVGALAPSPDQVLVDRLLSWPTVRRTDDALAGLARAAGLRVLGTPKVADPGRVLLLGREDDASTVHATREGWSAGSA